MWKLTQIHGVMLLCLFLMPIASLASQIDPSSYEAGIRITQDVADPESGDQGTPSTDFDLDDVRLDCPLYEENLSNRSWYAAFWSTDFWRAQSFIADCHRICGVMLELAADPGFPILLEVSIRENDGGLPGASLGFGLIINAQLSPTPAWVGCGIMGLPEITPGETYFIMVRSQTYIPSDKEIRWYIGPNTYPRGELFLSSNAGEEWSIESDMDAGFRVYGVEPPEPPGSFNATWPTSSTVNLFWEMGAGSDQTIIRRSTSGYPTSPTSGVLVYEGSGEEYLDMGLNPETRYYYSAWAYNTESELYSLTYSMDSARTLEELEEYSVSFETNPAYTGSLTFDGTTYSHGQSTAVHEGSYSLNANPPSGLMFSHWGASGGISIANASSASTSATVSNEGSITVHFINDYAPPDVETLQPSYSSGTILRGDLISMGGYGSCQGWFVYDNEYHSDWEDYANATNPQSLNALGPYEKYIGELATGNYHCRAIASNGNGTVSGEDILFHVENYPYPIVEPGDGIDFGEVLEGESAQRTFEIYDGAGVGFGYSFEWGEWIEEVAPSSGHVYGSEHDVITVTINTTGLPPGTHATNISVDTPPGLYPWDYPVTVTVVSYLVPDDRIFYEPDLVREVPSALAMPIYTPTVPFPIELFLASWDPNHEEEWLQDYGFYGVKADSSTGYLRSAIMAEYSFLIFDIIGELIGLFPVPVSLVVENLFGVIYEVPVVTAPGTQHMANISFKGDYEGEVHIEELGGAQASLMIIQEEGPEPDYPRSSLCYTQKEIRDYSVGAFIWGDSKSFENSLNHDNHHALVGLVEGETYIFWISACSSLLLDGYSLPGGFSLVTGRGWSDMTFHFEEMKIEYWRDTPPPAGEYPPERPELAGPTIVPRGESGEFTASTTDPNGDDLFYRWFWGDGSSSEWVGPYPSGEAAMCAHAYSDMGVYRVRVQAKEDTEYQQISLLSDSVDVSIPGFDGNVLLDSPLGGEEWPVASTQEIRWQTEGAVGDSAVLQLYEDGGEELIYHSNITTGPIPIQPGSYLWEIDPEHDRGTFVLLLLSEAGAVSSGPFALRDSTTDAVFLRGDTDASGEVNISDPIESLCYQFATCDPPICMDAADCDDSGEINISDPIYSLAYQFGSGPAFPAPYPSLGPDPTTQDPLECGEYPPAAGGDNGSPPSLEKEPGRVYLHALPNVAADSVEISVEFESPEALHGIEIGLSFNSGQYEFIRLDATGCGGEGFDFLSAAARATANPELEALHIGAVPSLGLNTPVPAGRHTLCHLHFARLGSAKDLPTMITVREGLFVPVNMDPLPVIGEWEITAMPLGPNSLGDDLFAASELSLSLPTVFRPGATVSFHLPEAMSVRVEIFDVHGRRVSVLANEEMCSGTHRLSWSGHSDRGVVAETGIFYLRAAMGDKEFNRKILYAR